MVTCIAAIARARKSTAAHFDPPVCCSCCVNTDWQHVHVVAQVHTDPLSSLFMQANRFYRSQAPIQGVRVNNIPHGKRCFKTFNLQSPKVKEPPSLQTVNPVSTFRAVGPLCGAGETLTASVLGCRIVHGANGVVHARRALYAVVSQRIISPLVTIHTQTRG